MNHNEIREPPVNEDVKNIVDLTERSGYVFLSSEAGTSEAVLSITQKCGKEILFPQRSVTSESHCFTASCSHSSWGSYK